MYDVSKIRADFPILSREVNGKPLVYLDNGASSQKPEVVIDAITRAYKYEYANVHRGLYYLSNLATEKYESVRGIVARFLNASDENEIVLNSGTTCLLYTSDAADDTPCVDLGGRRIIKIPFCRDNYCP